MNNDWVCRGVFV